MENLPIVKYRQNIIDAVCDNSVVVITAETGAGKSTQVPQFLMEEGYQVVVTQPRRLAARTVAERVAEEVGCQLGKRVGYRTGYERMDSEETQVLFCTDGLQLIREITGTGRAQVLVIDEVHEWNINIETLVAWAKKQITEGWDVKVVLMSATLEAEKLAKFFGENVPVIEVPGRVFPVESKEDGKNSLISNIKRLIDEGRNVLVFQPGKKEIAEICDALEGCEAEVLPLHGQLEPADQKKCFCTTYSRPKVVVATNVAQTSITIPDIDAVVDSGIERRVELVDGIEGLYLKPVSQADCQQRRGRAGRTKEGVYILCSEDSLSERPAFPKAEIERSRLDQLVLRLANVGIDATDLEFFHQPDREVLVEAKRALHALGGMTSDGQVTKIGQMMAKLPVSVQFSRMIVEANKLGVVDDVITIAAILEIGGIRDRRDRERKWCSFTEEEQSDLLAELDLWEKANGKKLPELREMGIFVRSYFRAKELRRKIEGALHGLYSTSLIGNRESIKRACVAGMVDHLYHDVGCGDYRNGGNGDRQKARESVVSGSPDWIVGLPIDIQFRNRSGNLCILNLVSMVTSVDPMWLAEVAPQLVRIEEGIDPYFDVEQDSCFSTRRTFFNDQLVKEEKVATPEYEKASEVFCTWLANQMVDRDYQQNGLAVNAVIENNRQVQKRANELNIRAGQDIFHIMSCSEWQDWLADRLNDSRSAKEVVDFQSLRLPKLDVALVDAVIINNPDMLLVEGKTLAIEYGRGYCRTAVDEEFARNAKSEAIIFPSGRIVEVCCSGNFAKTFKELVEKLEASRIFRCWNEKRFELEHTSWISNPEDVFPYLPKLLSEVEITRTDNGNGELVLGYFSLYFDSDPDFQIKLRDFKEEAEKETQIGLERLFKKACREALIIPKEEPWSSGWSLSGFGNALQARFEALVTEYVENLNLSNIKERIEALKVACETAKTEIGGEYIEVQQLIKTTKKEVEACIKALDDRYFVKSEIEQAREVIQRANDYLKSAVYGDVKASCEIAVEIANSLVGLCASRSQIKSEVELTQSEVSRELNNLQYGYNEFEDATAEECSEASSLLRDISNALYDCRYEKAIKRVEEARQLITRVRSTIPERQAARRMQFSEEIWEIVEGDEQTARDAVALAQMAVDLVGFVPAFNIFSNEFHASYGRARRQNALLRELGELEETELGKRFFKFHRAEDVNCWLRVICVWLEEQTEEIAEAECEDGIFTESLSRHFLCSCGCQTRVTKREWKQYQAGEQLEISCDACGATGLVKK